MQTLKQNLIPALAHWLQAVLFGLIWGLFLATHSYAKLWMQGWQDGPSLQQISLLIFAGSSVGGALGWFGSILIGAHRPTIKRFSIAIVVILLTTIGITALLFALHYRHYYSQWHMQSFTVGWFFQLVFTGLSALYMFAVLGLRTLLPLAPVGLLIAAYIFAKRAPNAPH